MLMSFNEVSEFIKDGKLLHIAGSEGLLRKLPKGKWIGGSTEYFMSVQGGKVSDDLLFVTEFSFENFSIKSYDVSGIKNVVADGFDNGLSILIVPFDSDVHKEYSENAAQYEDMFMKHIVGWISGVNLQKPGQVPIAVDGKTGEVFSDKAVALHFEIPEGKTAFVNIINIFEPDDSSPVITFDEEGFSIKNCFIDGREVVFADYITENNLNTQLPLVGDYSGAKINTSFKSMENGVVNTYAPLFSGIEYRLAKNIPNYAEAFGSHLEGLSDKNAVFSCNCILNFLYGELEGKNIKAFAGPITFGEIAYQLVNQTLVYVTVQ